MLKNHYKKCSLLWIGLIFSLGMGCKNYEVVMEDLAQREANIALVILKEKGIDAQKEILPSKKTVTYQIKVKKEDADAALRLLVFNQIPSTQRPGLKDVFPPGSSGIIPSKSDELARLVMATQGEIEALLKVVPRIADARVVISFELHADFNKPGKKTASVAIMYRAQQQDSSPPLTETEIKQLVASSVSGLLIDDVMVIQKMIHPIEYLDNKAANTEKVAAINLPPAFSNSSKYLLGITLLALIVAGYFATRMFFERRRERIVHGS